MDIPAILISQYLASLQMLEQAITQCPESIWNAASDKNKFWQVAYHALYFTHEYLADTYETFTPWVKHREVYDFDESQIFEPYDKESVLEYLVFCQRQVVERVPQLKLGEPEGHGRSMLTLELQIYSIRHLMQHTGELMERLGTRTGAEIDWVGRKHG
ncbi:MAG TPA: DinB family protein [Anaerolineales bacterium]|nr:DinB family protein [Anaerolineales bacterium]